eukprot:12047237-Ditylum_brightwellii.AAC.1
MGDCNENYHPVDRVQSYTRQPRPSRIIENGGNKLPIITMPPTYVHTLPWNQNPGRHKHTLL